MGKCTKRFVASGRVVGGHYGRRGFLESSRYMFGHDTRTPRRQEAYWIGRLICEGDSLEQVDHNRHVVACRRRLQKLQSTY